MTQEEMRDHLLGLGVKREFKLVWEPEGRWIMVQPRKPARIENGKLIGTEIAISSYPNSCFVVWTSRKQKASLYAKKYNILFRGMDGEAELFVPPSLADEILPEFGAKIRRKVTPEMRERGKRLYEMFKLRQTVPENG